MTYAKKIACALALAAGFAASQSAPSSTVYGADDQPGVAKSGAQLDKTLFDVPDGKDAQFYKDRLGAIEKALNEFAASNPPQEALEELNAMIPDAYFTIFKNLYNDKDATEDERGMYFQMYAILLARKGEVDALVKLQVEEKAKDKPDAERVGWLDLLIFSAKIDAAVAKKDAAALKALADEILDAAMKSDEMAQNAGDLIVSFAQADKELSDTTYKKLLAAFENAPDKLRKNLAENLKGKERFNNLVGNEMVVEGLFLDGSEIDWKSYRGKVVLVDFFATWCGPCVGEIPNIKAMYDKYHDKGFDVISYSVDSDLDTLKKFEEEKKLPWKTASETMSVEKKNDKGEPLYKNLSNYYGIDTIPRMILVGKDGKVIDSNARGERLTELLEKEFGK